MGYMANLKQAMIHQSLFHNKLIHPEDTFTHIFLRGKKKARSTFLMHSGHRKAFKAKFRRGLARFILELLV